MSNDENPNEENAAAFSLLRWCIAFVGHGTKLWDSLATRVGICNADIVHSDLYWICTHQQDDGQGKATQCLIAYRRGHSQAINLAS